MDLPDIARFDEELPAGNVAAASLLRPAPSASQPAAQVWSAEQWPAASSLTRRCPTTSSPAPRDREAVAIVAGVAQRLLEVAAGRRTPGQIRSLLQPDLLAELPGWSCRLAVPPRLRRVRAQRPRAGVIEAAVVYDVGDRVEVVALQLTRSTGGRPGEFRWRCSALERPALSTASVGRAAA